MTGTGQPCMPSGSPPILWHNPSSPTWLQEVHCQGRTLWPAPPSLRKLPTRAAQPSHTDCPQEAPSHGGGTRPAMHALRKSPTTTMCPDCAKLHFGLPKFTVKENTSKMRKLSKHSQFMQQENSPKTFNTQTV